MFEKKHLSPSMVLTGIEAKNGSLDANSFAVYALSNQVVEQRNKRAFLGELKDTGLISNDTLEDYQWISFDALEHVLAGNERGGAHHIPSALALGANVSFASKYTPNRKHRTHAEEEAYRVSNVVIDGVSKEHGSTVFPDSWATEQVLDALVLALGTQPLRTQEANIFEKQFFDIHFHEAVIDNVRIRLIARSAPILNDGSPEIITAHPITK